MKNIVIKINTENAAFEGCPEKEVSRILVTLANKIENGENLSVMDINGNKVGEVIIE